MSVRFKFRSSPNYDSVDIGGQTSISVRDLKSRIVQSKKLNLCQDFDLLFSDPISGQEYVNEDFQIPCGSSVIIKRVPAGVRVGSLENFATTDTNISKTSRPENVEAVNFDDFGAELCPVPNGNLSGVDLDIGNKFRSGDEETNIKVKRCCEQPVVECHKFEVSDISEAIRQGQDASETKLKPDIELNNKLSDFPAMQAADFPSELKCSLCDAFFKEAVMIPCCQHSFCEKCICYVLVEKARCPKCFSTKCKVEDLLPNLSLRQAIDHFLKTQFLLNGSENALRRYAPDGESGIQVKDVSCAVSVCQRGAELPPSPSATGRGSNQVLAESVGGTGSQFNGNHLLKDKTSKLHIHKMLQLPEDLEGFAEFQGENQPISEEDEINVKKRKVLGVNTADAEKSYMETGRLKKGNRACYMCGCPDHLMRDCPAGFSPHPMLQRGNSMFPGAMPGYVSSFWNGPPFPHIRPFANPYGSSGMMPYYATVIPTGPFAAPTYVPSVFGGSPAFGFTRMGGIAAATKNNINQELFPSELDVQDYDKRHQYTSENVMRKHFYDEDDVKRPQYDEAETACDKKFYHDRERSASYSEESFIKKSLMKHWHPHAMNDDIYSDDEWQGKSSQVACRNPPLYHHSERSRSEVDDMPSSSSWHSEERHQHDHRNSKKRNDRKEQYDCDSSWLHYPTNKEKNLKSKTGKHGAEIQYQKHYNHSQSSLETIHSTDQKKKRREKDCSRSSRHSGQKAKSPRGELSHERWQMMTKADEDNQEHYHYYKRKRIY
ncbi:hypothetical protein DITRI_Ditri03aG0034800 [Diplodiscus trichospermus]